MKRKLGVTLLIIATTLAGTPEAVKQFHDLNTAMRHWASNSLGSSFLVYAAGTNERALPDRYDYHQVAPRPATPAVWSYGLTANLSPVAAPRAHDAACPWPPQRTVEQPASVARARANVAPLPRIQTARRLRAPSAPLARVRLTDEQLTRELERAAVIVGRALGAKLRGQALTDEVRGQEAETKLKGLRLKTAEMLKLRRVVPVKIARLADTSSPRNSHFADLNLLPAPVIAFMADNEAPPPASVAAAHVQRICFSRAGKAPRLAQAAACAHTPRETSVSPYVVTTAINAGSDGFNADNN